MTADLQTLTRQATSPSADDRALLARSLWESVTPHQQEIADVDFDQLARQRHREMDDHPEPVMTHEEVMEAALRRFA